MAPGRRFDVGRTLRDTRALAALGPRPTGSPAAADAVRFIVDRLEGLGVEAEIQTWSARQRRRGLTGRGQNVVARLAGRRRGATLVSARYDTVSAGAPHRDVVLTGDSVSALASASLLELARVLGAGKRLDYDVVLLFTDGTEGELGSRGYRYAGPWRDGIRAEVTLEPAGGRGPCVLLSSSPDAGALVDLYARAVDRPSGSSSLSILTPPGARSGRAAWPRVALGSIEGVTPPGSPADRPGRLAPATVRELGQSALDLIRAIDHEPVVVRSRSAPIFFQLPFHILIATDHAVSAQLSWLALAIALVGLVRARRALPAVGLAMPWLLGAGLGALGSMLAASELLLAFREVGGPTPGHVLTMVFAGTLWLLAWQRLGVLSPARRLALGLSEPVPLLALSVLVFCGGLLAVRVTSPVLAHLFWGPAVFAVLGLLRARRALTRRGKLGAATIAVAGALCFWLAPLQQGWAVVTQGGAPGSWSLALLLAGIGLILVPPLAAMATASVLRPGAGQIALVSLVTVCLGIWSGSEASATRSSPQRVVATAVTHARRGRSVFLASGGEGLRGRRVPVPSYGPAVAGPGLRATYAPDGLSLPPHVEADVRREGGRAVLLTARVRPLRRAHALTILLPSDVRVHAASWPTARWRRGEPWSARYLNPPAEGLVYRARVELGRHRLGDVMVVDEGPAVLGPFAPVPLGAHPTQVTVGAAGVTPLDVVYAAPPPPPPIPPDIAAPAPAGPDPWWSIMARERYRSRR